MTPFETCKPRQASSHIADDSSDSIMFLPCGVVSFDHNDVRDRYCARCDRFITKSFEFERPDRGAGGRHGDTPDHF
jgi:hypothetical protein